MIVEPMVFASESELRKFKLALTNVLVQINNAGQNPGAKSLMEFADEEISSVSPLRPPC
jgi:hypothetical protein